MGETPLGCLERYRADNSNFQNVKMTYAGRLDPMAEGELLMLADDECQDKEKYLGLNKEYEFDVLFGFGTDTYDILGPLTVGMVSPRLGIMTCLLGQARCGGASGKSGEVFGRTGGEAKAKVPTIFI